MQIRRKEIKQANCNNTAKERKIASKPFAMLPATKKASMQFAGVRATEKATKQRSDMN